ncbi:MAG TPA: hypothetical protein VL475_08070, partial [Planctomycetaceae bacterium]|nr:hypothetical protein [Planctomycetaceae bacterium]
MSRWDRNRKVRPRLLLIGAACLSAAACGTGNELGIFKHDEKLIPVEGQVLIAGQPAKNATVIFHRQESLVANGGYSAALPPNPHGDCDEDGVFRIYTYMAYDGAPAGKYVVTVSWKDPEGRNREDETYPELAPRRY